ncbi:hypothetical protein Tco_0982244 [Tanacetum coccineum]
MGRDANNQMFSIAWVVVTMENKDNLLWFLVSLVDDLNFNRGATMSIVSDGHKGLKETVREWLPLAEHRQYTTSATLKQVFDGKMGLLRNLNEKAHQCYHVAIVNQRGKPIIAMLEDIRIYLMQRLWEVYLSGYREFEVRKLNEGYGVNLETHKYTCRQWDLTRIPCVHDVAAYAFLMKDHADGVLVKEHGKTIIVVSLNLLVDNQCGQSGFESVTSALKRMRMDASVSGSGQNEEENVQGATNSDPGQMEQLVHMEEHVQEANRCENEKTMTEDPFELTKKPFQFDAHGTRSTTTEKAFDISNE